MEDFAKMKKMTSGFDTGQALEDCNGNLSRVIIDVYLDPKTREAFQVSEGHGIYREAPGPETDYEAPEYGPWIQI